MQWPGLTPGVPPVPPVGLLQLVAWGAEGFLVGWYSTYPGHHGTSQGKEAALGRMVSAFSAVD